MNYPLEVRGRHYHNNSWDNSPDAVNYGLNFEEQWARARLFDPEYIFVCGWNEWVAMRYPNLMNWYPIDRAAFPDTFNQLYSRDVEPMTGGHTDNYYYQMIGNIRKYVGVEEAQASNSPKSIVVNISGGADY
jgi:hypothetical protein